MRASIDRRSPCTPPRRPATWVLSNHDVTRPVTRYGRADTSFSFERSGKARPTDLERGTRRARAAALLAMALPGSLYVYQGEELGLPEVEDIPHELRQDPMWHRSGGIDPAVTAAGSRCPGTATCRPTASAAGSDSPGSTSPTTGPRSRLRRSPRATASMLSLYRAGLRFRRAAPWGDGALRGCRPTTRFSPSHGASVQSASSTSAQTRSSCPQAADVLIASNELEGGALPHDTTVWLRQTDASE